MGECELFVAHPDRFTEVVFHFPDQGSGKESNSNTVSRFGVSPDATPALALRSSAVQV